MTKTMSDKLKYTFTLTKRESDLLMSALEFYFRMFLGQYKAITEKIKLYEPVSDNIEMTEEAEQEINSLLLKTRGIIIPSLRGVELDESLGIFSKKVDVRGKIAFDIFQVARLEMSKHESEEEKTYKFVPDCVVSSSDMELPKVEYSEDDDTFTFKMTEEHYKNCCNALFCLAALSYLDISYIYNSYLTDDSNALNCISKAEKNIKCIYKDSYKDFVLIASLYYKI